MKSQSFQRGLEPKESMNIGRKAIIKKWLDDMQIENYTINDDCTIDVNGDVWLEGYHLNDVATIPEYIKFRDVKGKFVLTNTLWQNKLSKR